MQARGFLCFLCALVVIVVILSRVDVSPFRNDSDDSNARDVETLVRVNRAREYVIVRLREGQITLWEAGAMFREQNDALAPQFRGHVRFHGNSEQEQACRQVISWVQARERDPEKATRLVAKFEEELERKLDEIRGMSEKIQDVPDAQE
jgi:hypothetical protein